MNDISPREINALYQRITDELSKVIVGQEQIVRLLLASLFSRGHCLLVGVPGLAKTLLVKTLAEILQLSFKRIQFTPDLMPSDIIGSEVLQERDSRLEYEYQQGPIFANLILADEINRTPPKTQAALLEAMQERKVTIAGKSRALPDPFLVVATQNPIEQEGTYPLARGATRPVHVFLAPGLSEQGGGNGNREANHVARTADPHADHRR